METINESMTFGYTSVPFNVKQNIEVIKRYQDKRCPLIDLGEKTVNLLNFGRYIIVLRIYSEKKSEMFFLDYVLPIKTIVALNIFTSKETEVLAEMRHRMLETNTEADDDLAVIASIYN